MAYSCARFVDEATTLEEAQEAKHELVCRKLGLATQPGTKFLDVGCGWGSMALHAASHHGANVVGITLSQAQVDMARQRVAEAGLEDQIEVRLQDYRTLKGEHFDAISSIGMSPSTCRGRPSVTKMFRPASPSNLVCDLRSFLAGSSGVIRSPSRSRGWRVRSR
jgi:cyclopropane-fatty-acyl-phospholipid synthase